MSLRIQPDTGFITYLRKESGADLSACMQCGNCTAICDLSPTEEPYPRKEMIWAAWGMKDLLMKDPDIWLCHQCGDCTAACPRGVKPGEVLAAVRKYVYMKTSRPAFLGKWMSKPVFLPVLILIPALIIAGILSLAGTFSIPDGPVDYSAFFPHAWLNVSFSVITLSFYLANLISMGSYLQSIENPKGRETTRKWQVVREILSHQKFRKCSENKTKSVAHLLVFYGFISLLLVTMIAVILVFLGKYPLSIWHPVKILGNLAGLSLALGLLIMIIQRLGSNSKISAGSYIDWFFLISLFLLALSGGFVEWARFADWSIAYHLYFVHLLLVWMVIMYLPYTKFGHVILRTMVLLKYSSDGKRIVFQHRLTKSSPDR